MQSSRSSFWDRVDSYCSRYPDRCAESFCSDWYPQYCDEFCLRYPELCVPDELTEEYKLQ